MPATLKKLKVNITEHIRVLDEITDEIQGLSLLTRTLCADVIKFGMYFLTTYVDLDHRDDVWQTLSDSIHAEYVDLFESYITYGESSSIGNRSIESIADGVPTYVQWTCEQDMLDTAAMETARLVTHLEYFDIADHPIFNDLAYVISRATLNSALSVKHADRFTVDLQKGNITIPCQSIHGGYA